MEVDDLLPLLVDKGKFSNIYFNNREEYKKKIDNNFYFLYKTLLYPDIVNILLNDNIDYTINRLELIELTILHKYYNTVKVLLNHYKTIFPLFDWGFTRDKPFILDYIVSTKGKRVDNSYKRMSKYYLYNKLDKKLINILLEDSSFVSDYIAYYFKNPKKNFYYHKQLKIKKYK
jgi:hypothetical protein